MESVKKISMFKSPNIIKGLDDISLGIYGMTRTAAHKQGVCLNCKEEALPKCYSEAGQKEYQTSALCERCFDETE